MKFPDDERLGLVQQLRRAAISVSSNIAEGSGRSSKSDQNRFYRMAFSSALEVICQLTIARELKYFDENVFMDFRTRIETITRMINKLCN